ncbi:MAG: CopD family protein [Ramlibacter sp.]
MPDLLPWLKFVHLSALLAWCAALFALPTLLALYPQTAGGVERRRLRAATRFTYIAVASPAAVIAVVSGTALIHPTAAYGAWLLAKLTLVTAMVFFHAACGKVMLQQHDVRQRGGRRWQAWLALVPAAIVPIVLWLVLAQPRLA